MSKSLYYVLAITLLGALIISCGSSGGSSELKAPGNLLATAAAGAITLSWDDVGGATSYTIYWSNSPGAGVSNESIESVTSPYTHEKLIYGETYYYTVIAINNAKESVTSEESSATPNQKAIADITFTDTDLEACVTATATTYADEINDTFNCASAGVGDLTGLGWLTSIQSLDISSNTFSDIGPLRNLGNLTYLNMMQNNVTDISPAASIAGLLTLNANYNDISDITSLASHGALKMLHLQNNNISDISTLSSIPTLYRIYLDNNTISDLTPLANLTVLNIVQMQNNDITDISMLDGITSVRFMYFGGNDIISGISNIVTLTNLTNLDMTGNTKIPCDDIDTFNAALPGVNFTEPASCSLRMFVSSGISSGNLGGISGADAYCMNASYGYPGSGTYKALIADGTNRIASVSANAGDGQVDWVLAASTDYIRLDESAYIGVTDSNALLEFFLDNAPGTTTSGLWTGLNINWTSNSNDCTNWTSTATTGAYGSESSTATNLIYSGSSTCTGNGARLLCVEQ